MLAPIHSPEQQLLLAIQHHRNHEVDAMLSGGMGLGNVMSGGYADIHVACRYNNRHALEALLSRGVPVDLRDRENNTPLHYAAKNGHIDICRFLVDRNAPTALRNSRGQSAYDVAQSHVVRQYLLPLQLACERADPQSHPPPPGALYGSAFINGGQTQQNSLTMHTAPSENTSGIPTHPPHIPPSGLAAPLQHPPPSPRGTSTSYSAPPSYHQPPQETLDPSMASTTTHSEIKPAPRSCDGITSAHPPPAMASAMHPSYSGSDLPSISAPSQMQGTVTAPLQASNPLTHSSSSSRRVIQPDGFGSSASDPVLQKKYGHTKTVTNIAPPPVFGSGNSTSGPAPGASYSMYGSGAPGNPLAHPYSRYVPYDPNSNPNGSPMPPPAPPTPPLPYSNSQPPLQGGPHSAPPEQSSMMHEVDISSPVSSGPTPSGNISMFNPVTDKVVSATSSSSAIL